MSGFVNHPLEGAIVSVSRAKFEREYLRVITVFQAGRDIALLCQDESNFLLEIPLEDVRLEKSPLVLTGGEAGQELRSWQTLREAVGEELSTEHREMFHELVHRRIEQLKYEAETGLDQLRPIIPGYE